MKVTIIGRGGMGKLFGRVMAADDRTIEYIGRDVTAESLSDTDVIVIATPSDTARDMITLLSTVAGAEQKLVICLWSYMRIGYEELKELPVPIVYLHFLFGPDIEELNGQNIIIAGDSDNSLFVPLYTSLREFGARLHVTDALSHDKAMAYTQSLSQLSSILLGISLAQSGYSRQQLHDYASLTFRLNRYTIERIMGQKPELWAELQFENEFYPPILEKYVTNMHAMVDAITRKDQQKFTALFNEASDFWEPFFVPHPTTGPTEHIAGTGVAELVTLGPAGTYSQAAAIQFSPDTPTLLASSIRDALTTVIDGRADRGIIPIENSIQGVVTETLDGLCANELVIEDEVILDVHHALCALERPGKKELIKIIYSHPQALAQCRDYLAQNYPDAVQVPTASTAAAMQKIADQKDVRALAIGPAFAAQLYSLAVVDTNIEDEHNNQTRFVVFSRKPKVSKILPFILIAVFPHTDRSGILSDVLSIINDEGVNLSQIESRPDRTKLGSYMFYLRLGIPSNDERYNRIVKAINSINVDVRRLSI